MGANFQLIECCSLAGPPIQPPSTNNLYGNQIPNFFYFIDILDEMLRKDKGKNALDIIQHYYSCLTEQRYCHKTILDIFNQISSSNNGFVAKNLLSKWMATKYSDPSMLWIARKNVCFWENWGFFDIF